MAHPYEVASRDLASVERSRRAGRLEEAAGRTGAALVALERAVGPRDPNLAVVLAATERIAAERGDRAGARRACARGLRLLERAAGPDADALRCELLRGLAWVERAGGRYAAAERRLGEAAAVARRLPRGHLERARVLNDTGVIMKYTGRFATGARLYARARRAAEAAGEAGLMDLATIEHNIGGLEHARRRFAAGEPPARRAVELRTRLLGPRHLAVASDAVAHAALLDGLGRHDESEPIYRRALRLYGRAHGGASHDIAATINNLAVVREARGDLAGAERLHRRALAMKRSLLGAAHPGVGLTLHNLGTLVAARGRRAEARRLMGRAVAILEGSLGRTHPDARTARAALGRT